MMRGGEIFVPKIPSMRVIDLAHCMAPHLEQRFVGIRPGEKLHEVMITEDDSRHTLELADRYVIEPIFSWWERRAYVKRGAQQAPDGFCYASNLNQDWLDEAGLKRLMAEI
jgi:UDP-N-acetylglucosamine 4,6-dehydratase